MRLCGHSERCVLQVPVDAPTISPVNDAGAAIAKIADSAAVITDDTHYADMTIADTTVPATNIADSTPTRKRAGSARNYLSAKKSGKRRRQQKE